MGFEWIAARERTAPSLPEIARALNGGDRPAQTH
jgi:hypothetical protein